MSKTKVAIIDCECDGPMCCGGKGIAVFQVVRNGKKIRVCTRCDLGGDTQKKILRYVLKIPTKKLVDFDALGAFCLSSYIQDKKYPLTRK